MLTLVTGGSGSGKSAFAEDRVLSFGEGKRIYIAMKKVIKESNGTGKCAQERDLRL